MYFLRKGEPLIKSYSYAQQYNICACFELRPSLVRSRGPTLRHTHLQALAALKAFRIAHTTRCTPSLSLSQFAACLPNHHEATRLNSTRLGSTWLLWQTTRKALTLRQPVSHSLHATSSHIFQQRINIL